MRKRLLGIISTIAVSSVMVFIFTSSAVKAATLQDRLWGNDRYQTNSKIVDSGWTTSEYAVIASGDGFADALCAAPLAQQYKAPILLTSKDTLSTEIKSQLSRLNVKKAFIIGGTGVISDNVKSEIESMGIKTNRIYGQNRFETSIEVAKNLQNVDAVVVSNGYGFADALSIAPIAAQKSMPILLTDKTDLASATKDFLANKTPTKSYILGGTGVVSDKIASQLKNNIRLGGNSRYETNAAVLNHFADKFNYDKVYVASGENYPDALSGSVLAASNNSPLVLVGNIVDSSVMSSVKSQHDKYNNIVVLGGIAVVSNTSANSIVTGVVQAPSYDKAYASKALDVKSSPGEPYKTLGTIETGTTVEVYGGVPIGQDQGDWFSYQQYGWSKIKYKNEYGWLKTHDLIFSDPYAWAPGIKEKFENDIVTQGYAHKKESIRYVRGTYQGFYSVYTDVSGPERPVVSVNAKTGWYHG